MLKKISLVILVLIIAAGGYGYFWFRGLSTVDENFTKVDNVPADLSQTYKSALKDAKKGGIIIKEAYSQAMTQKLFNETSFLNFGSGSSGPRVESLNISTKGDKANIKMIVNLNGVTASGNLNNEKFLGYSTSFKASDLAASLAPSGIPFLKASKFGVSADVEFKTFSEGIGIKPVSISVGNSPIPVGVAMAAVKQYAPQANVNSENYIILGPMTVTDKSTGKVLFVVTGFEVKDGELIINTK